MSLPTLCGVGLEGTDGPACEKLTHRELGHCLDRSLPGRDKSVFWVGPCDIIPMIGVDTDPGVAPGCLEAVVLGVEIFSCWICCPICWDGVLPEAPPASSS
ncbi:hypothetical protein L1987_03640 [Smallanthus sonchifolius]|uniref:Uncharacterized protein n=1 Tax=Smallanthus sonchifolius TaxID=185202 RepID=A0ACB9KB55_9ASTR|nr:hypothetical protein L1987_03640 [Smallanthus sonchifolius]